MNQVRKGVTLLLNSFAVAIRHTLMDRTVTSSSARFDTRAPDCHATASSRTVQEQMRQTHRIESQERTRP